MVLAQNLDLSTMFKSQRETILCAAARQVGKQWNRAKGWKSMVQHLCTMDASEYLIDWVLKADWSERSWMIGRFIGLTKEAQPPCGPPVWVQAH